MSKLVRRWTLAGMAAGAFCLAGIPVSSSPTRAPVADRGASQGPVTGRLLDLAEKPIVGARLLALPSGQPASDDSPPREATTGEAGHFALGHLPAGLYDLGIVVAGHPRSLLRGVWFPPPGGGQGLGDRYLGDILLDSGQRLVGRVVDGEGKPVAGAGITLGLDPLARDPRWLELLEGGSELTATSSEEGRFEFPDRGSGDRVTLRAESDGFLPSPLGHWVVGWPGAPELTLQRGVSLAGWVLDGDGRTVAGARVELVAQGRRIDGATDGSGRFELAAPEGEARLRITAQGYAPWTVSSLEIGPGMVPLEVFLEQPARLRGTVYDWRGRPLADVSVLAPPASATEVGSDGPVRTVSGVDGGYDLTEVPPGDTRIVAVTAGGRSHQERMQIAPGSNQLDLVFEPGEGEQVRGTVATTTGDPIEGAEVRLQTAEREQRRTSSDAEGRFSFDDVAPGEIEISARKQGHGRAPGRKLDLGTGGLGGVELRLPAAAELRGNVLGLQPQELPRLAVEARPGNGPARPAAVAADGSYRVGDLEPGSWTVVARVRGSGRWARRTVAVAGRENESVDLTIEPGHRLTGLALLDGMPAAAVRVSLRTGAGFLNTVTDAAGGFEFTGLAAGPVQVSASMPDSGPIATLSLTVDADRQVVLELSRVR